MQATADRLEPSQLTTSEIEQLEQLLANSPCLVGSDGIPHELPIPISQLLLKALRLMRMKEVVLLMPEHETVGTQAAANYLGVSRPFLVRLLESGEIPFYKAGTHRRVRTRDLKTYRDERDGARHEALRELFDRIQEAGLYGD